MIKLFESTEFILALVLGSFMLGRWIFTKTRLAVLHPVVISIAIIIAFLKLTGIDYQTFAKGSDFVNFLLGPTVVALGYLLYEQLNMLRQNTISILTAVFVGSIVGISSVIILAHITGADQILIFSLEPKSVTTPIAMSISEQYGGNVSLTAIIVVVCGIYGSIIGPPVMKFFKIESSVAKGLALGASSHGIGTARAMEMGVTEGAISGLAIGLMGVMTALMIPVFHWLSDLLLA